MTVKEIQNNLREVIKEIKTKGKELDSQLSCYDIQEQDLLHCLEVEKCNAVQLVKISKQLKDIRLKRRDIKIEHEQLQSICDGWKLQMHNIARGYIMKQQTVKKGWKLFEMDDKGNLYPLFINKKEITPMNKWVMAEIIEYHPQFSHRPGWHLGSTLPSAPWLMGFDGTYKSQRGKRFKRVWCEVWYLADIDYTEEVQQLPKKCFTDRLPDNGFYNFRESGNRLWVIADRIKVVRILSEKERMEILKVNNYDEQVAFEPYRQAMVKRMKVV